MNHLIMELYNNGNIILTDANYEVIALLRTHQFADDINLKVREIYPISFTTNTFTNSTTITITNRINALTMIIMMTITLHIIINISLKMRMFGYIKVVIIKIMILSLHR